MSADPGLVRLLGDHGLRLSRDDDGEYLRDERGHRVIVCLCDERARISSTRQFHEHLAAEIDEYVQARRLGPRGRKIGAILGTPVIQHPTQEEADAASLAEQGRLLASQRDDLIAQGIDPAELAMPLHPAAARREGDER